MARVANSGKREHSGSKQAGSSMTARRNRRMLQLSAAALAACLASKATYAANGTWINLNGGLWSAGANWNTGAIADGASSIADFSTLNIVADTTVSLDSSRTIGQLKFADTTQSNNWTLDNGGNSANVLTLSNGASQPIITVNGAAQITNISVALAGTNGFIKTGSGSLTLSGNNTYSGQTTVNSTNTGNGSDLYLNSNNALGTSTLFIDPGSSSQARVLLNSGVTIGNNIIINTARSTAGANGALMTNGDVAATINGTVTINNKASSGGLLVGPVENTAIPTAAGNFFTFNGAINFSSTYTNVSNNLTNVAGNGLVLRAGNIRLAGGGNYNRAEVRSGVLQVGANNGINTGAYLDLGGNANGNPLTFSTLDLNGFNQTLVGLENLQSNANTVYVTNTSTTSAATLTLAPINAANGNGGNLVLTSGGAGTGGNVNIRDESSAFPLNLTINGDPAGVQTINSPSSSYHGVTTLTSGILSVNNLANGGSPSSIGASPNAAANLVFNGGTLRYTGGGVATDRGFTTNTGGTIEVTNSAATLTLSGGGVGTGGMTKIGPGTLALTGTSTYAGNTAVSAGTLLVNNDPTVTTALSGNVSIAAGATLGGAGSIGGTVTPAAGGIIAPAGAGAIGTIAFGALNLSTNGLLNLEFAAGNDQITIANPGGLALNNGTINLYNIGATTAFSTDGTYTLFKINGGFSGSLNNLTIGNPVAGKAYTLANTASTISLTIGDIATRVWSNANGTNLWTDAGDWTGNVVPNGVGQPVSFGAQTGSNGNINLNGNKTVGGIVFNNSSVNYNLGGTGTLTLDNASAAGAITVLSGAHTISVPLSLAGGTSISTPTAADALTISGNITGAWPITVNGPGMFTLNGANSFTTISVDGSIVNVGTGGAGGTLGSGNVTLANSATLNFNTSSNYNYGQTITGSGSVNQAGSGTVTVGAISGVTTVNVSNGALAASTISQSGGLNVTGTGSLRLTASGGITGAGKLTVNTSGTVSLSGANTYTGGTEIDAGLVTLNSAAALPANAVLAVNGGTLDLNANNVSIGNFLDLPSSTGVITNKGPAASTSTITFNGDTANYDAYAAFNDGPSGGKVAMVISINNTTTSHDGIGNEFKFSSHTPSTYSGGTIVNSQSIEAFGANAFGTGPITFSLNNSSTSNSRLYVAGGAALPNNISIAQGNPFTGFGVIQYDGTTSGSATINGSITISADNLNGGLFIGPSTATTDFLMLNGAVNVSGAATTIIQRGGNVQYGGGGNYPNLSVTGLAQLGASNGLSQTAAVALAASGAGTLELNGFNQTLGGLSGPNGIVQNSSTTLSTLTMNPATTNTFGGTITGNLALVKAGTGTFAIAGTDTYTGNTNINAGVFTVNGSGSIASPNVTVASGATANINGVLNASPAVTANGTVNIGANAAGLGIKVPTWGTLSIGSAGVVNVATPAAHTDRTVLVTSGLTFAGTTGAWQGKLDLAGNDMIIHNATAAAAATTAANVANQLKQGSNLATGFWDGSAGIVSSTAAADPTHLTALGMILNNDGSGNPIYGNGTTAGPFSGQDAATTDVLVKYTYFGDADLSGHVDGTDYSKIDNGFNNHLTGWFNGDFNYDGVIDGSDYSLIDNAFNTQGASLGGGTASAATMNAGVAAEVAISPGSSSAVPEPGALGLLCIGGVTTLARRRRRPQAMTSV